AEGGVPPWLARRPESRAWHAGQRSRSALVADITYVRLLEEFAFLAVVLDAFSRRVVGWALDSHLRAALAVAALQMALAARRPSPGQLVHHSDRGIQYACAEYSALLEAHGIQPSMSRIG